jgi:thiamine biosynthesis lipoprotein
LIVEVDEVGSAQEGTQIGGVSVCERTFSQVEMLLGTLVRVSVRADNRAQADAALDAAFDELRLIHALMSFHRHDSDVSRLNRASAAEPTAVNFRTVEVLRIAQHLSELSRGHFDITVAPDLVSRGHLPPPAGNSRPDEKARWRDIELLSDEAVVLHKRLWLDLGGIAKGYAVDRATGACLDNGASACIVEAGGDMRVTAGISAAVRLSVPGADHTTVPLVELTDGSLASSQGLPAAVLVGNKQSGPHFNGVTRKVLDPMDFVTVLAEECVAADALTKVVMSLRADAAPVLAAYSASALIHHPNSGWSELT